MDIIHLLPDSVANQIAAGEVVQRPASVIKELLENAIDAHATSIQVILREAGRDLIQVIDNGVGMSSTDARMAFERHATSKIRQANDLFALHTMGFRGEALASIAAVAEVELRTRRAEDETGILIALAGCKVERQESVTCPVGANFSVRNLFYNVPARRKFLKSNQTELSNIITELQHVALANPQVEIMLTHNDTVMLQLSAGNHRQRITQLFAKTIGNQLLPVSVDNDLLTISGFVGLPESARKKSPLQYFFVNDRYMKHPYFHKAVMECYQDLVSEGAQPNYFLYLTVDPSTIDVNIHPTKTEIKFENEPARWHILMATIREALGKFNAAPAIDFDQADAPEIAAYESRPSGGGRQSYVPSEPKPEFQSYNPFSRGIGVNTGEWEVLYESAGSAVDQSSGNDSMDGYQTVTSRFSSPASIETDIEFESAPSAIDMLSGFDGGPSAEKADRERTAPQVASQPARNRVVMQVGGRYIATPARQGLMLIDQHAAHVCILFNRYYQQICNRRGLSQRELFPEILEIAPADVPVLESIMPQLGYLGFEIDNLGGGSYSINGKPASIDDSIEMNELIRQMIDTARDEVHGIAEELHRHLALRLSQSLAIPSGKVLHDDEMQQMLDALFELSDYSHTPDGHSVCQVLTVSDIASRF